MDCTIRLQPIKGAKGAGTAINLNNVDLEGTVAIPNRSNTEILTRFSYEFFKKYGADGKNTIILLFGNGPNTVAVTYSFESCLKNIGFNAHYQVELLCGSSEDKTEPIIDSAQVFYLDYELVTACDEESILVDDLK